MTIKEYTLQEALLDLPSVTELESFTKYRETFFDFYMTALGFEERTLSISENLANISEDYKFRCDEAIYFIYATSTNDNAFNEPRLKDALGRIKNSNEQAMMISNMFCDEENFNELLTQKIDKKIAEKRNQSINILVDLSASSSKLILSLLKIIFNNKKIHLTILYTEAKVYEPKYEEYIKNKEKFLEDSGLSTTRGNEIVVNSNEYSEGAKEASDLIVAFAPFKYGRINRIVSDIDESILLNSDGRLVWLVGSPNFSDDTEKRNRINMLKEINNIDNRNDDKVYEVSTLDYKETLIRLEEIYLKNFNFHMNIADLGSKMQTLAISIFYHIRPDVSVYYVIPKQYNSSRYSHGVKCHWEIDFGSIDSFLKTIKKVDQIEIEYINKNNIPFHL